MRQIGVVHIHDTPGAFGISLPQRAEVVGVDYTGTLVALTYLAPVDANWTEVDVTIAWTGTMVSADQQYVGRFRRSDGRDYYVFIRRD